MKRSFLFALLFWLANTYCFSQDTAISLSKAIPSIAGDIGNRLASGTIIAVVNFDSASREMNDHALRELINALANERSLIVVGRGSDLDKARNELNINLSRDFSDESAQRIGRLLGAQMVVYGSLSIAGADYRLMVQALEVQTAIVRYSKTLDIKNDRQVQTLMGEYGLVPDFNAGERIGTAALNLAFGLGSFVIEKDVRGGAITAALEGIGVAAVITSFFLVEDKEVDFTIKQDTTLSRPVFIGGLVAYTGGAIFGVYRALSYKKPGVNIAEVPLPWNIALIPTTNGNTAVMLSYTLRF